MFAGEEETRSRGTTLIGCVAVCLSVDKICISYRTSRNLVYFGMASGVWHPVALNGPATYLCVRALIAGVLLARRQ